jgi:2-methylisocitrate lyase-like PEP mutase family enzyme
MSTVAFSKAEQFHALHFAARALLLPNVWDGMSAAACVAAGFQAIATTSCGIAWSLGYPDGERMLRSEMIAAVGRIVRVANEVPVTADIEAGYASTDDELANTISAVIDAGAIGINLEDGLPGEHGHVRHLTAAANRIRIARSTANRAGVPLVINARTDGYLAQTHDEQARDLQALARCKAYLSAGADCVYPIGLRDPVKVAALVRELNAPVNAMHPQSQAAYDELCKTGVARISTASLFALACFDQLQTVASELSDPAKFGALKASTTYQQVQTLFAE